jgi:phytoene dehydrogenase-like protein
MRQGYTIDGCIHNLAGTIPASAFYDIWRELGVIPARPMHSYKELVAIERPGGGEPFVVHADLDRLEAEMKRLFPIDAVAIGNFVKEARRFAHIDLLGIAVANAAERIGAVANFALHAATAGQTLEHYALRFQDQFLRQAFPSLVYDWPQQSMSMLLYFLARLNEGDLGWPIGGSGEFAKAIEKRFIGLGGKCQYQSRAVSILVENDRTVGVRLEDGSEERADIIVSNAYGPATIFNMLGGRYVDHAIAKHYATPEDRIEMGVHVSFGVARDLSGEPHSIVLPLERPTEIDGELRNRLFIQTFGYDPSMAPPGKGVLKVLLATKWSRWERLAEDPRRYKAEQELIARTVVPLIAKRFPGIEAQIEVTDVATPQTTQRFTGNGVGYKFSAGEMMNALLTGHRVSQTLPGLRNFYMVGQWAGVPGVPMTAAMGRDVVRDICRRDGKRFVAAVQPELVR